jgi:hypothetical protein
LLSKSKKPPQRIDALAQVGELRRKRIRFHGRMSGRKVNREW